MVIRLPFTMIDRVVRLWRLLQAAGAPPKACRSVTATMTTCVELGLTVLEAEVAGIAGLVRPTRTVGGGDTSVGIGDGIMPRCELLARRYAPALDSRCRPRIVTKHAIMRWAAELGLDRFESHFGVYGVAVQVDERGIPAV